MIQCSDNYILRVRREGSPGQELVAGQVELVGAEAEPKPFRNLGELWEILGAVNTAGRNEAAPKEEIRE